MKESAKIPSMNPNYTIINVPRYKYAAFKNLIHNLS